MRKKLRFCVIGGDLRLAKLAEFLAEDGHSVLLYAMETLPEQSVAQSVPDRSLIAAADCVVLPLPVVTQERTLNAPFGTETYGIGQILDLLCEKQIICAGMIPGWLQEQAKARGLTLYDYFTREEMAVANAVPTAEGVIQLALQETPATIQDARVLVIGYGKTGKLVAHRFAALCARVSVAARNYSDLAWIEAYGYTPEDSSRLDGRLSGYDIVINTVPARVLPQSRLEELRPGCLCIDIASSPGGIDIEAAARLGVNAIWALSLPGRVAPVTAGKIIRNTVYHILHELGA